MQLMISGQPMVGFYRSCPSDYLYVKPSMAMHENTPEVLVCF